MPSKRHAVAQAAPTVAACSTHLAPGQALTLEIYPLQTFCVGSSVQWDLLTWHALGSNQPLAGKHAQGGGLMQTSAFSQDTSSFSPWCAAMSSRTSCLQCRVSDWQHGGGQRAPQCRRPSSGLVWMQPETVCASVSALRISVVAAEFSNVLAARRAGRGGLSGTVARQCTAASWTAAARPHRCANSTTALML